MAKCVRRSLKDFDFNGLHWVYIFQGGTWAHTMRLNKSTVDTLPLTVPVPPATQSQAFHRDDLLTGFAVRITETGARAFIVETKANGKTRRATLGKTPT